MNVLALDAMGGDLGVSMVIEGASLASAHIPCHFLFFGHEDQILSSLKNYPALHFRSQIVHTDLYIPGDMQPSKALRIGRKSSLGLAIQAVKDQKACAVVSAGNTGAYMALSKILLEMIPGIQRPAIPALIPNIQGKTSVVLDLGANIDCSSDILVQFSLMGVAFASYLLKIENPSVGLLNVGTEFLKGPSVLKEARERLESFSSLHFEGFVEDLMQGRTDVVVADGFSGNLVLKAIEGTARFIKHLLKEELSASWRGKLGYQIGKSAFLNLQKRLDPRYYNGAVFLGLEQVAVKSHGGTDAFGFSCAIQVAYKMKDFVPYFKTHSIFNLL